MIAITNKIGVFDRYSHLTALYICVIFEEKVKEFVSFLILVNRAFAIDITYCNKI